MDQAFENIVGMNKLIFYLNDNTCRVSLLPIREGIFQTKIIVGDTHLDDEGNQIVNGEVLYEYCQKFFVMDVRKLMGCPTKMQFSNYVDHCKY